MEASDNSFDASAYPPAYTPAYTASEQRQFADDAYGMRRDLVVSLAAGQLAERYGHTVRIELLESIVAEQFDVLAENGAFERQMVALVENLATARVRKLAASARRPPKCP